MTIINMQIQLFEAHREQMHDVANIQIKDPVILIFYSKNGLHIVLQLDVTTFSLWKRRWILHSSCVVVCWMSSTILTLLEHLFRSQLISDCTSSLNFIWVNSISRARYSS